jgi:hypothetical protein
MLTIIIQREHNAKSEDDKAIIGRVFSALNRDKILKQLKRDGGLQLAVTKRQVTAEIGFLRLRPKGATS